MHCKLYYYTGIFIASFATYMCTCKIEWLLKDTPIDEYILRLFLVHQLILSGSFFIRRNYIIHGIHQSKYIFRKIKK